MIVGRLQNRILPAEAPNGLLARILPAARKLRTGSRETEDFHYDMSLCKSPLTNLCMPHAAGSCVVKVAEAERERERDRERERERERDRLRILRKRETQRYRERGLSKTLNYLAISPGELQRLGFSFRILGLSSEIE